MVRMSKPNAVTKNFNVDVVSYPYWWYNYEFFFSGFGEGVVPKPWREVCRLSASEEQKVQIPVIVLRNICWDISSNILPYFRLLSQNGQQWWFFPQYVWQSASIRVGKQSVTAKSAGDFYVICCIWIANVGRKKPYKAYCRTLMVQNFGRLHLHFFSSYLYLMLGIYLLFLFSRRRKLGDSLWMSPHSWSCSGPHIFKIKGFGWRRLQLMVGEKKVENQQWLL
jgi:hypothetical protein